MPKITHINFPEHKPDRVYIFIDNVYCTSIRKRTFIGMNLKVGSEIGCDKLKEDENFFWKNQYGKAAWEKEKVRLGIVKHFIESIDNRLKIEVVGFGADTTEYLEAHPEEHGKPDLVVLRNTDDIILMRIEVTGTEIMRGTDYWVRPDKLKYNKDNPEEDVWVILHFLNPVEKLVFIQPDRNKLYNPVQIALYGAGELMCIFKDSDEEVKTQDYFTEYLKGKI